MIQSRSDVIDNLKAIGIVLIVFGHTYGIPTSLRYLAFSFHVPLFFFVSGFLMNENRISAPIRLQASFIARRLLKPYIIFFLISYAYWLITRDIGDRALKFEHIQWWEPLSSFFTGAGEDLFFNMPLWFFPSLICATMFYFLLRKFLSSTFSAIVATTGLLLLVMNWNNSVSRLPFGLDTGIIGTGFFAMGFYMKRYKKVIERRPQSFSVIMVGVVMLWVAGVTWCGKFDLNKMEFGREPFLYVPIVLLGILVALFLAKALPRHSVLTWLSTNTLLIFSLHALILNFIVGLGKLSGITSQGFEYTLLFSMFQAITTLWICYLIQNLVQVVQRKN